jgi:hypothetical protein
MESRDTPSRIPKNRPTIEPSTIGQFIALDGCPRYFQFEFKEEFRKEEQRKHDYKEAFEPLSLLLSKEGKEFEHTTHEQITAITTQPDDNSFSEPWEQTRQNLKNLFDHVSSLPDTNTPFSLSEVRLHAEIGA